MEKIKYILTLFLAVMVSCSKETPGANEPETPYAPVLTLTASIGGDVTKTSLGQEADGKYPVSWTVGDRICVNGAESGDAVFSDADAKIATFSFNEILGTEGFKAVYPASAWKTDGVITVPAAQTYIKDSFDPASAIMLAYSADAAESLHFSHLMAYLVLSFDTEYDKDPMKSITVKSNGDEPMSGDFNVDFTAESPALTPVSGTGAAAVTVNCGDGVALGTEVVVAVPAQTYASGIEITAEDSNGHRTTRSLKSSFAPKAGTVYSMPINFDYYPGTNLKPIKVGDLLWAPVYCGYSKAHPNGLLYQYGRAVGQPYYPAGTTSAVCKSGPVSSPGDAYFYKKANGDWYSGTSLTAWPMSESDAGYLAGKIGNPCPNGWRIPTMAECEELVKIGFTQSTIWSFGASGTDAQKNAAEVKTGFTLNGDSGLFFAAVGGRTGGGQSFYRGIDDAYARIWASDKNSTDNGKSSCLSIQRRKLSSNPNTYSNEPDGFDIKVRTDYVKAGGISVRCVKDAK